MDNKNKVINNFLTELNKKDHKSYLVVKLFIKFLKREGVLESYIKNLKSQRCYSEYSAHRKSIFSVKDILNGELLKNRLFYHTLEGEEMFNYAFCWSSTEEGQQFWANISLKWRSEFKGIVKKIYVHE
jgi:hypothetical protein